MIWMESFAIKEEKGRHRNGSLQRKKFKQLADTLKKFNNFSFGPRMTKTAKLAKITKIAKRCRVAKTAKMIQILSQNILLPKIVKIFELAKISKMF